MCDVNRPTGSFRRGFRFASFSARGWFLAILIVFLIVQKPEGGWFSYENITQLQGYLLALKQRS